jgi:glycine/D-amino acid oxidase-like deaminating enzyme
MGKCIWTEGISVKARNALQGNVRTDVLVIGGGLCGILCAYELNRAGVDCLLVEAEEIAGCTTKNTTAKITSQHGLIYDSLLRSKGKTYAAGYLEANQRALEKYRTLSEQYDFDFEEKSAFVYSLRDRARIERRYRRSMLWDFRRSLRKTCRFRFPPKGRSVFRIRRSATRSS